MISIKNIYYLKRGKIFLLLKLRGGSYCSMMGNLTFTGNFKDKYYQKNGKENCMLPSRAYASISFQHYEIFLIRFLIQTLLVIICCTVFVLLTTITKIVRSSFDNRNKPYRVALVTAV